MTLYERESVRLSVETDEQRAVRMEHVMTQRVCDRCDALLGRVHDPVDCGRIHDLAVDNANFVAGILDLHKKAMDEDDGQPVDWLDPTFHLGDEAPAC